MISDTTFFHSPRSWKPRRWFFWLHLYAGLVVGLLALVIGLSGAALVYSPELEVAPRWAAAPVVHPMPLAELTETVMRRFPGFRLQDIGFNSAGDATQFHIQLGEGGGNDRDKQKAKGADLHLVVDPETGAVLKKVDRHSGVWHFLRELHHDLLAARTGRLVNGIGALALFVLCATGMMIWWPGPKLWRRRVGIQGGANWKRFNWDLHNASGFWLAAGLAFFSFTGFQYAFPDVTKGALRWITGSPERPKKPRLDSAHGGQMAGLSLIVARAKSAAPDGTVQQIKFPKKVGEPIEARLKTPFDGHHEGNNRVFLDATTGEVVMVDRFDHLSLANRAIELLEPLHNARFMAPGWTSVMLRLPWIVMGLAPGLLFVTGFLMWWNRVVSKKREAIGWPSWNGSFRRWARAAGIVAVIMAAAWGLSAQDNVLGGRVLDPSGAAIAGARVTLRTFPERTTRTEANGAFQFLNAPPGVYPVTVEAAGFEAQSGELRAGTLQEFRLGVAPVVETITVNAGTLDEQRLEDPLISTGIGRNDIASRNNRRLSDVVARMPGIFLTGPPGGEKDVRLRGLDKEYSRTQVDGIVIPDGGEKREFQLNRIPSSVVETVRIIRNPTAEFESDGLAGRIAVETRPIPEGFHVDGRLGSGARRRFANDLTQGQLSAGSRVDRRVGFTAGYNFINDNLPIGREKLLANRSVESENEAQHQRSGNFFGDLGLYTDRFGDLHFKPIVLGFVTNMDKLKQSANAAGALLSRSEESEDKSQQTRGLTVNHQFTRAWGLVWDTQAGWFRSTEDKDKLTQAFKVTAGAYTPDKRTPEVETKADRTWNFSTAAAMPLRFGLWHEVKFGAAARFRDRFRDKSKFEIDLAGKAKDATTPKDRYHLTENYHALFVQDRLRITDSFSIMPGVRAERVRLTSGNPLTQAEPRVFLDMNPSAHLLYRIDSAMSVHAAVSRGLARPKFDELSPFETEAATKITIGNTDLEPARAWSYDAGLDYATGRMTFSLNAFRKTVRGVIEEVDTGLNRGTLDVYQVQNVGNGWVRGLEIEQRLRMPLSLPSWARAFSVWANQTFLSSRLQAANGSYRPFKEQPAWIANVGLDYNNDEKTGTAISVISNFTARRFDYKPTGDVTGKGGSTNIDVAVYQRLRGNWRFFMELNNLTNRDRTEDEMFVNGTANRRIEAYGRTLVAGVRFGF